METKVGKMKLSSFLKVLWVSLLGEAVALAIALLLIVSDKAGGVEIIALAIVVDFGLALFAASGIFD